MGGGVGVVGNDPRRDIRVELDRIALAVAALIRILGEDPRVQVAMPRGVSASSSAGTGTGITTLDAIKATIRDNKRRELEMLEQLTPEGIHAAIRYVAGS